MTLDSISAKLQITIRFLQFWSRAKSIDSIDSPLLYQLSSIIRTSKTNTAKIIGVEKRRRALLKDDSKINKESLGAPSTMLGSDMVSIRQIARSAVSPQYKCVLLKSIIEWSDAISILELGTSLAISTAYIAAVEKVSTIVTVEGSQSISTVNEQNKHSEKIRFHTDSFQHFLTQEIEKGNRYDCIVLDGHHQYAPTLNYIDQFERLLHPAGVIIMDDIYWSKGMIKAWEELKSSQRYNLSIDLFFYGILSKKPSIHESIDVKLWPFRARWQLGLFR